jgi:hypothetical protein
LSASQVSTRRGADSRAAAGSSHASKDGSDYNGPRWPFSSIAHADTTQIGDVFVIAMENQNSAVSGVNASGLNPIYGNSAAPYINSLITPGNPNAQYVSYSSNYTNIVYNSTNDLHPSEPNYIYQISGQFGVLGSDAVPSTANGNLYGTSVANLGQSLTSAGLTWKSYQEDIQIPGVNVNGNFSGTNGPVNPYNGTTQYNYAAKHNPFVFFEGDSSPSNYARLTQLSTDLAKHCRQLQLDHAGPVQ